MSDLDHFEPTWAAERKGYIRCRAIGHSWHDYDSTHWRPQFGTPLTLRCERCGMERRDVLAVNGRLINRYYLRPQRYQMDRGEIRPSRDDFRIMLLAIRGERKQQQRRKAAAS